MKRRRFIQYAGAGFAATATTVVASSLQPGQAQTSGGVSIQYLGHSCFLFSGQGNRVLVNPFRPLGCTAGYRAPRVNADLVMISSRLLDEGSLEGLPGTPRLLSEPGVYEYRGMQIQGIRGNHDRQGGRRFGLNTMWRWNQGGLNIAHLGGAVTPIQVEQQILIGRPDVLLIPVGGGAKIYTPEEAAQAVRALNPRLIIPTQYRTQAATATACDIQPLDAFLAAMPGVPVQRRGDNLSVRSADLPAESPRIEVLSYRF